MKTYTAIPTRQYLDTPERSPIQFKAPNMGIARQKVQNHLDMSYIWDIVENDD